MSSVSETELVASAVAPRVTLEALEANIASVFFINAAAAVRAVGTEREGVSPSVTMPESLNLLTLAFVTLQNGFVLVGQSACASLENYNQDIGERLALEDAKRSIWALMGYELRSRLMVPTDDDSLGEALTHMTAMAFGNPNAFKISHADTILKHFKDLPLNKIEQEEDQNG